MALEMAGRTLVVVHGVTHPSDADWERYLDALRRNAAAIDSQLIVTDGGSPTSAQRKASLELASHWAQTPPTAVVTSSVLARGAVTALSWFMKDRIRAFPPDEFDEACAFIGASSEAPLLRAVTTSLRATLG
jgi:DNA-binding LacI/PurR family transcriptional regulator